MRDAALAPCRAAPPEVHLLFRFAVFGDVHGRVALMLTLARRWQQATACPLDGILQVGDMGAFPDHARLDASTRRFSAYDPDQLGFCSFLSETADSRALLAPPDTPPIAFCRGNHEDFAYLSALDAPAALDPWGKLWFVPDGAILDWAMVRQQVPAPHRVANPAFRIGAFGGAAPLDLRTGRGDRAHKKRCRDARSATVPTMAPQFTPAQLECALGSRRPRRRPDVLLTHAGPVHPGWRDGSPHLERLARAWQPRVHLFGHHHQVLGPISTDSGLLVGLEHLEFRHDGRLRDGSWGILSMDDTAIRFDWVSPSSSPWVAAINRSSWRQGIGAA